MTIPAMAGETATHGQVLAHAMVELDLVFSSLGKAGVDVSDLRGLRQSMERFLQGLEMAIDAVEAPIRNRIEEPET